MKNWMLQIVFLCAVTGCQSVNPTTVGDLPTGYLCEMLGPKWTTLPEERKAIYRELDKRKAFCGPIIGIRQID